MQPWRRLGTRPRVEMYRNIGFLVGPSVPKYLRCLRAFLYIYVYLHIFTPVECNCVKPIENTWYYVEFEARAGTSSTHVQELGNRELGDAVGPLQSDI